MHGSYVLPVNSLSMYSKRSRARSHLARGSLRIVRVLRVRIVLANINHRQLPQLGHVHLFVNNSLAQGSFTEEAHRNLRGTQIFRGKCRARRNPHTTRYDCVRAKVASRRIGDMHRPAFPLAVTSFLTQKLSKHSVRRRALRQAVPMSAMRARNVIVIPQRFANSHSHSLFANVQMRESRHQRPRVKLIHLLLEQTNSQHLSVHPHPLLCLSGAFNLSFRIRLAGYGAHFATPDIRASTSNTTAKSFFSQPIPRAAVKNSLLTAVVGSGTFNCRPNSMASNISFCIMFTSNHASGGCCNTNGPRY